MGANDDAAGYESRLRALAYAFASPFSDLIGWWGFLPLGGERSCRRDFVRWLELRPRLRVVSLCCGTGSMERAMLERVPQLEITGVDLGSGPIARARRRNPGQLITYLQADSAATGLGSGAFDRVLIALALHEMRRPARLAVLREARRLCARGGRVLAIEHGRPLSWLSRLMRALWWFHWIPGNPEVPTTRDLQRRGLSREMRESDLEVVARRATRPEWIEAIVAVPRPDPTRPAEASPWRT